MSEPNTNEIDAMSREELIARARELSINRPELMTRVELRDEIIRVAETDEERRKRARGWLGVARDLVASVVEQRLNLPDAAELIRGANLGVSRHVPPVATVTLAEIYAAQGHLGRAIRLLDEVLSREPDHAAAMALRATLIEQQAAAKAEPAVRQSDLPEPHDLSEPWEGDPIANESADDSAAEAEAMAAIEEVSELTPATTPDHASTADAASAPEVSGIASVVGEPARDDAVESWDPVEPRAAEPNSMDESGQVSSFAQPAEEGNESRRANSFAQPAEEGDESRQASSFAQPAEEGDESRQASSFAQPAEEDADSSSGRERVAKAVIADERRALLDELLLYRRSGSTLVCHWQVQSNTWEYWQGRRDGEWVLRIFQVKASEGPLECEEKDLPLPGLSGEVLFEIDVPAQVRLAVGWKSADHFQPIIIGVEIAGDAPENLRLAWCPLPSVHDPPAEFWLEQACQFWPALSVSGA